MVIQELGISNYRGYRQQHLGFSPNINFFVGENGQGKTNLVEALYVLIQLASFRENHWAELIRTGEPQAELRGGIQVDGLTSKIRVIITRSGRKVWQDDQNVQVLSQFISRYHVLLFNAESVYAFRSFPAERRQFFDRVLAYLDPLYLKALKDMRDILAQKNQLLKTKQNKSLDEWNALFLERSRDIITRRKNALETINHAIGTHAAQLLPQRGSLKLEYQGTFKGQTEAWAQQMESIKAREMAMGHALIGPHRDDWRMSWAEEKESHFSQGEYRSAKLALLLTLNHMIRSRKNHLPVLILDDLFSEIDPQVQAHLMNTLAQVPNQVFITATDDTAARQFPQAWIRKIQAGNIVDTRP